MFLKYEQVAATSAVKRAGTLSPPSDATHAELQASTQDVRYTMDNVTNPSQTSGMVLGTAHPPKTFLIEDVRRIRFTRGTASDGNLNIHYFGGRSIT